jgi:hypothetical protein
MQNTISSTAWVLLAFCVLSLAGTGCGPAVSREELGTVLEQIPKVAGAQRPFPMPELGPPIPASQRTQRDEFEEDEADAAAPPTS